MFPRINLHQWSKEEKGVTLPELIIVIALMGIIVSVVFSMFFTGIRSYETIDAQVESYYDGRWTFMYIERQIKSSEEVYIKDNIVYLQDMDTPEYYNYYYLRETGILERHKVHVDTLDGIGRGETSQLANNIKSFELKKTGDTLLQLRIVSEVKGKNIQLESYVGRGIPIKDK